MAEERARVFGVRTVERRGVRVVEPAHGVKHVRDMLELSYEADAVAADQILNDAGVSAAGRAWFKSIKVVARMGPDEDSRVVVQPNIPGLHDDALSNYADTEEMFGKSRAAISVDEREKTYKLHALFSDVTLTDKLRLSARRLQTARRLAACDPAQAAASLTDCIQSNGFPNARVIAGDYAKSVARVRQVIREFADSVPNKDAQAPAQVTATELRITFDGFVGVPEWTVFGPLAYALEIQAIYKLCLIHPPNYVLFILAVETAQLRINVRSEATGECFTGQLTGYSSLEGIKPGGYTFPPELTSAQQARLRVAAEKVIPVHVDDAVIGSAVQVSDKRVILNEHTLNSAVDAEACAEVRGEPVVHSRSVAHDICVVSRSGGATNWALRDAIIGERVVVCYSVGVSEVEYSEVLQVRSVFDNDVMLTESAILRKGTSGGAVVALRDGALLGIFSTKRGVNVVCSAFSSAAFQAIAEDESVVTSSEVGSPPPLEYGDQTYGRMVKRGYQGFLEGIGSATLALYTSTPRGPQQVGTVANHGGDWLTTVDPTCGPLVLSGGHPLVFRTLSSGISRCESPPELLSVLPNVRMVVPGERVFVFARAGEDVAMSLPRTVTHRLADSARFVVEDFGDSEEIMAGGLIVAESDAAVVGQYMMPDYDSYGAKVVVCVDMCTRAPVESSVSPVQIVPAEVPVFDAAAIRTELVSLNLTHPAAMDGIIAVGRMLLELQSKREVHASGRWDDGGTSKIEFDWVMYHQSYVESLGWNSGDWQLIPHGILNVSYAVIALWFMREPAGFFSGFDRLLTQGVGQSMVSVDTNIAGMDRPSSTVTVGTAVSEDRIRDLEHQVRSLTTWVEAATSPRSAVVAPTSSPFPEN